MEERLSAMDRLAGIFMWIYILAGGVGIVRLISHLLPFHSQLLSGILCFVVPCVFGAIYYKYIELPAHEWQRQATRTEQLSRELDDATRLLRPLATAYRQATPSERAQLDQLIKKYNPSMK